MVCTARASQESHGRRVELLGILTRDQDEQRRRLVQADVRQVRSCRARGQEIAAGERAA
jgi:hypothetical protein